MKFKKKDFDGMRFNIFGIEPLTVIDAFPALNCKAFEKGTISASLSPEHSITLKIDDVLKFIIYTYCPGSPLPTTISNFIEVREHALELSGLVKKIGDNTEAYERIVTGEIPEVNILVAKFFMIINARTYERWVSSREAFEQIMSQARKPGDFKIKKGLLDDAAAIDKDIEELEKKLFPSGNNSDIKEIVQQVEVATIAEESFGKQTLMERIAKNQANVPKDVSVQHTNLQGMELDINA